ncbi:MAG TPA: hypothetical protein O0W95_05900 [Methanocorpusculum sp.]|nr:hypothetical protein [Methanocorpusculum sp.]
MLTKPEKKAAVILLSVTAILILFYLGSVYLFPDAGISAYSEDSPDGSKVYLDGELLSYKITTAGGHVLMNVSGATVFVENGAESLRWKAGDMLHITGTVQTYGSTKEIAAKPSDISVV